ncbi:MAG: heme exporter protein CcmD [Pseudomonadota bacterium]
MAEFFHMGGYASYVWSSYGLALIVLLPALLLPLRENKRLRTQIKGKYKREQAIARQQLEQQDEEKDIT